MPLIEGDIESGVVIHGRRIREVEREEGRKIKNREREIYERKEGGGIEIERGRKGEKPIGERHVREREREEYGEIERSINKTNTLNPMYYKLCTINHVTYTVNLISYKILSKFYTREGEVLTREG